MARFLHTADWHLGRSLHSRSLLDDQAHVLDQFVALARSESVDAVLVAGDVYDRSVPGGEAIYDPQSAMAHVVSMLRAQRVPGQRNVLVGHAFVAGGSESDSERPLTVGGSGRIAAEAFEGFDYVALGHLHRPQSVGFGTERIRYAGSLLKYSFNEVEHEKGVSLVEIGADGKPRVQNIPLSPLHDMRIVTGTLADLLQTPDPQQRRDDYLRAVLTDSGPVLDPMARLREVYPHMMDLQFERSAGDVLGAASTASGDHRRRQPLELFQAFYRDMLGEEASVAALEVFKESVQTASRSDAGRGAE